MHKPWDRREGQNVVRLCANSMTREVEAERLRYGALWLLLVRRGVLEVRGCLLGLVEHRGRL